jgi:hypothetical protein
MSKDASRNNERHLGVCSGCFWLRPFEVRQQAKEVPKAFYNSVPETLGRLLFDRNDAARCLSDAQQQEYERHERQMN